jgi:multicomponent Na+:H+ antiporter subunit E
MMRSRATAVMVRGVAFLVLWAVLAGVNAADLPAAAVSVVAATWTSLRLMPSGDGRSSLPTVARMVLRFPLQSLIAGIDVARRAFSPRLPLSPGFVPYVPRLPPGTACDAFCALASLMPGTLPADTETGGTLLIHCLDTRQPVAQQLADEEALFARALGGGRRSV